MAKILLFLFPALITALRTPRVQVSLDLEVTDTNTDIIDLEDLASPDLEDFASGFHPSLLQLQDGAPPTGKLPQMWNPSDMDKTADPKTDFYQYAVGGWVAANAIPDGYSDWSSFSELNELNTNRIQELVKGLKDKPHSQMTAEEDKISDFYETALHEDAIEAAGIEPLKPILAAVSEENIGALGLSTVLGKLTAEYGIGGPYGCGSQTDNENSKWTLLGCDRSGISLVNRDYYLEESKADIKKKYEEHVGKMLALLGDSNTAQKAADIVALETKLAKVYMDRVMRRDPKNQYHKMELKELQEKCKDGSMDWEKYFEALGQPDWKNHVINVGDVDGVVAQGKIFKETPVATLNAYLRWKVVHSFAAFDLPKAFVQEHFNFWSTTMYGVKDMKPRWKRALGVTQAYLSMAVGKIYAEKYFSPSTKTKALGMVEDLRSQLERRLKEVDWIKAETTRAKALEKVQKFGVKIGYPDKWYDYSSLEIKAGDHFGNVVRARLYGDRRDSGFVNKPTDKTQWGMSPQTINAYYDPTANEICFPAGILQPPFFDATKHDAFNYGGIGAVIGHEMTHGFDDSGRKYNAEGNLEDWWTEADAEEFEKRASVLVGQTNAFKVFGVSPNGKLTNGENLADLGGLKLAYGALEHKLGKENLEKALPESPEGFTNKQLFFLSFAKNWATNANKEGTLAQIASDPHPPHQWRANGPTSNMEEFHQAFGSASGAAMFREPADRVQLW